MLLLLFVSSFVNTINAYILVYYYYRLLLLLEYYSYGHLVVLLFSNLKFFSICTFLIIKIICIIIRHFYFIIFIINLYCVE